MTYQLQLGADVAFNEVVRLFIERAATPVLGAEAVGHLARAGEETFTYVAEQAPGTSVRFTLDAQRHAGTLEVAFDGVAISPGSFNMTFDVNPDDEFQMDLPLLLAARSVDRFDLSIDPGDKVLIRLRRDREYPPQAPIQRPAVSGDGPWRVEPGSPELLGYFAGLVAATLDPALLPDFARTGERLTDMAAAGEVSGMLALNADEQIGGGLLWLAGAGHTVVRFFGPYVLTADGRGAVAQALVEGFIGAVSRGKAHGLFSQHGTADLPGEYFEVLGTLDGPEGPTPAVYRGLHEDHASAVWCDPALVPFLQQKHAELALAREIRPTRPPVSGAAVLSVAFDRARGLAMLRPILAGADAAAVVAAHVELLADQVILLAVLDLGRSIDATFIPALLEAGFAPRYVLPLAATGDVLVMQRPHAPAAV